MKKSLTIEDLKSRIGKPVFVVCLLYNCKEWRILKNIGFGRLNTLEFTDDTVIREDLQGKFRFFDEEVTQQEIKEILEEEVTQQEIKEILEEEKKLKKKTGYETVGGGENYFFITSNMKVEEEYEYQCYVSADAAREACANHFNDENLTENIARAERLKYQLRRFAALNCGIPSVADWGCRVDWKYLIVYDYNNQEIHVSRNAKYKCFGQIYFKSEDACKKAIEIFKDELMWYFTEFKEMLY